MRRIGRGRVRPFGSRWSAPQGCVAHVPPAFGRRERLLVVTGRKRPFTRRFLTVAVLGAFPGISVVVTAGDGTSDAGQRGSAREGSGADDRVSSRLDARADALRPLGIPLLWARTAWYVRGSAPLSRPARRRSPSRSPGPSPGSTEVWSCSSRGRSRRRWGAAAVAGRPSRRVALLVALHLFGITCGRRARS